MIVNQNQTKIFTYYQLIALVFMLVFFTQCEKPRKNETYYLSESEKGSIPYKLDEKLTMYSDNDTLTYIVVQDTIQIAFIADPLVTYWSEERLLILNDTIDNSYIQFRLSKAGSRFHIDFTIEGNDFFFSVDVFEPFENSTSKVRDEIGSININGIEYSDVYLFKDIYNEPQSFLYLNQQYGLISFEYGNDKYYFDYK